MPDDHGLSEALSARGGSQGLSRRSLEHLREQVLLPGEQVMALGEGIPGLIAMTTQRAVLVNKSFLGTAVKEIPLAQISSSQLEASRVYSTLLVTSSQSKLKVEALKPDDGQRLVKAYERLRHGGTASTSPATSAEEIFAQLERLGTLRDAGVLTEDEFTAKKSEMLGRL